MSDLLKTGLTKEIIQQIKEVFNGFKEIESVVLYGSRARGDFRVGSDIDLTIHLKPKVKPSIRLLSEISVAVDDLDLIYTFDLSFFQQIQNEALRNEISHQGIQFYP